MDPRARAVYRVDVRSFFDTDADGLGDINGVAAKIDYIKELARVRSCFHTCFRAKAL